MPKAPSSIERATIAFMLSRSTAVSGPASVPLAYTRTVPSPRKDPTFCDAPRPTMYSSHLAKPCGPTNCDRTRRTAVSPSAASSLSFMGPNDDPRRGWRW
jgi:hypothetical protein